MMDYDPKTRDYVVDYDFFDKTEEVIKKLNEYEVEF